MNIKAWLLWMCISLLLSFGVFFLTRRKKEKALQLLALSLPLSVLFGVVCSKLFYYLTQINFMVANGWLKSLVNPSMESFSFFGAVAGVCFGVALSAKLFALRPVSVLNDFAPAGLLLAALARFGEMFLEMIGTGPYIDLEDSSLRFLPPAIGLNYGDEYTEWYWAIFVLEGVALLIAALICACCFQKHRFLRSLFYLCLPQIILENLRSCSFYWFFCIRVEQLTCMVAMFVILLIYAIRSKGQKWRFLSPALALACAGLFIVAEFAMEQKIEFLSMLTPAHCYALMGLGTLVLMVGEIAGFRRMEKSLKGNLPA